MTSVDDPPVPEAPPPEEYPDNVTQFAGNGRGPQRAEDLTETLVEAERNVIGGMMLDPAVIVDVLDTALSGGDFYRPEHDTIYRAIVDLHAGAAPTGPVAVADRLAEQGDLRRVGGLAYLHRVFAGVATAANAGYYARIVRERALLRRLEAAGVRIQQLAQQGDGGDPERLLAAALAETQHVVDLHSDTRAAASTWAAIDVSAVDGTTVNPELLTRADGVALLYAGRVHAVVGEPESGKSWLGLYGIAQAINAGLPAGMIDFEDEPNAVIRRLLDMGCRREDLNTLFRYVRPDVALTSVETAHLERAIDGCGLVVVDGVTEAMTMHGLSLSDNEDIAKFLALLPKRVANLGPAVLQVDHVVKDEEARGRYALGGGHKLAGINGAQFKAVVTEPFGRGKRGQANIIVDKDREGGVRQHTLGIKIAELVIDSRAMAEHPDAPVGPLHCYLNAPNPGERTSEGTFRPTVLMGRVCDFLKVVDGASTEAILTGVEGKAETLRKAIRQLVTEGYVTTYKAERNATRHHLERHIDEDPDPQEDLP